MRIVSTLLLVCLALRADTLILLDDSKVNGDIRYDNGQFVVSGVWKSNIRDLDVAVRLVKGVRFNREKLNPGELPTVPHLRGGRRQTCEIELSTRDVRRGILESIDERYVRLSGKEIKKTDIKVLRITSP